MLIPHTPDVLILPIVTYWDGIPCTNTDLHAVVTLGTEADGLCITASLPHQERPCVPAMPPRTRVAKLWEYDVVECFVAGAQGYLEIELGSGGHFLVLEFAAPRECRHAYEAFVPRMTFEPCLQGKPVWRSSILIPWAMVPAHVQGVNAYVISRHHYLCYHPLPGPQPDFHQPERFPHVRIEVRA